MTDAERSALERKISEMREPTPTGPRSENWIHIPRSSRVYNRKTREYEKYILIGNSGQYDPRPWTRDERVSAVLRDEILQNGCALDFAKDRCWFRDQRGHLHNLHLMPVMDAVALAWVAMKEGI